MSQAGAIRRQRQSGGERLAGFVFVLLALSCSAVTYVASGFMAYAVVFGVWGHPGEGVTTFEIALVGALLVHHSTTLAMTAYTAKRLWVSVPLVLAIVSVGMLIVVLPLLWGLSLAADRSGVASFPF